jgi:flagellar capping protein FliD
VIDEILAKTHQKSEVEKSLDKLLGKKSTIEDELRDYEAVKQLLEQYDLTMADFLKSLKTIQHMKERGYDPSMILSDIQDVRYYNHNRNALIAELDDMRTKIQFAGHRYNQLQGAISLYSQRLPIY